MEADDYFAIQNLLHSYPYAIDRGDFDAVGQLFAHADLYIGGVLTARSDPVAVARSLRDWVITYPDGSPRTRHCLANVIIRPDGPERATTQSYVMVFQQTDVLPLQPVIGGDYVDRFAKVEGAWRFVERRMGNDLIGDLKEHGRDPGIITPTRASDSLLG